MKCFSCPQPYNPATGHVHMPGVYICGTCAREFKDWYKMRMNTPVRNKFMVRKGIKNQTPFYEAAMTSIKPGMNTGNDVPQRSAA